MAEGINRVILLGNLGDDPEVRGSGGSSTVCKLRLATTEKHKSREGAWVERTDWHSVVIFGLRGEALANILRKGSQILVEGQLRTSSYEARDGGKRYRTEVVARNIVLVGGRPAARQDEERPPPRPSAQQQRRALEAAAEDYGDDDIPF